MQLNESKLYSDNVDYLFDDAVSNSNIESNLISPVNLLHSPTCSSSIVELVNSDQVLEMNEINMGRTESLKTGL